MRYSVGEVANLLGLTTSAIHYYEKEGVIQTKKADNGHRYYELEDLIRLIQCKESRNREVSLKDIIQAFQDEDYGSEIMVRNLLKDKRNLEQRIQFYHKLLQELDDYITRLDRMEEMIGKYELEVCEPAWFIGDKEGNFIGSNQIQNEVMKEWADRLPFTKLGVLFNWDEKGYQTPKVTLGFLIHSEEGRKLKLPLCEDVIDIEKKLCLRTVIKCNSLFMKDRDWLVTVKEYIKKKKFSVAGKPVGILLFQNNDSNQQVSYVELWIPINGL